MKCDVPSIIYEMPTKKYWKSVYPDNGFQSWLAYWRSVLSERQNHRCCYCGTQMNDAKSGENNSKLDTSTVDHVIPKSKGGLDHPDNYVIACYGCNNLRGDQDAFKFAESMDNGIAKNCNGRRIQNNPPNFDKTALRKQLKEMGVKVNSLTKPCKLQNKLESFKIREMIKQGLPNTFELDTRAYKKYERYNNPSCPGYERMVA